MKRIYIMMDGNILYFPGFSRFQMIFSLDVFLLQKD